MFIVVVALLLLVVVWVVVRKRRESGEYSLKEREERELADHPITSSVLPGSVNTYVHIFCDVFSMYVVCYAMHYLTCRDWPGKKICNTVSLSPPILPCSVFVF